MISLIPKIRPPGGLRSKKICKVAGAMTVGDQLLQISDSRMKKKHPLQDSTSSVLLSRWVGGCVPFVFVFVLLFDYKERDAKTGCEAKDCKFWS